MKSKETIVIIKDKEDNILDKNQIVKLINQIKLDFNSYSRSNTLEYKIKNNNVFISNDDIFILEKKLPKLNFTLIK